MIYLAADHGGFSLKEKIKEYLRKESFSFQDLGTNRLNPDDDYPDYASCLARKVVDKKSNRGILICRSGTGMGIAANKIKGVKCGFGWNTKHTQRSRQDNDINVIALPADFLSETKAKEIVKIFLTTPFSGKERHQRRLNKIKKIEEKSC